MAPQRVALVGKLGKDPELFYTPSGSPLTKLVMVVDPPEKVPGDKGTWYDLVVWDPEQWYPNAPLDWVCSNFKKGSRIAVEGTLTEKKGNRPGQVFREVTVYSIYMALTKPKAAS